MRRAHKERLARSSSLVDLSHSCSSLISGWNWLSMIALKGNVNCAIAQLDATCALNQIQHVHVKYYRPLLNQPGRLSFSKLSVYPSIYLSLDEIMKFTRRNSRELISAKSVQTYSSRVDWVTKKNVHACDAWFSFFFFFFYSRLIGVARKERELYLKYNNNKRLNYSELYFLLEI